MELYADLGYEATSMSAVAEAAGLSPSGLAHHFRTREALLLAVLTERDERDYASLGHDLSPGWRVFDDVARQVEINTGDRRIVQLFTRLTAEAADPGHPGHTWLRQHHTRYRAAITSALDQGKEQGTVGEDVPSEHLASLTMAVMDGLQLQWLEDESFDMRPHLETFVAALRARWA